MQYQPLRLGAFAAGLVLTAGGTALAQVTYNVNTTQDTVDANPGDGLAADANGNTSLRAAIMEANAGGVAANVQLAGGATYFLSLAGSGEDAAASGDLDITGMIKVSGDKTVIDGLGQDRIFDVFVGGRLSLSGLTLTGGAVQAANGGAIRNRGDLDMVWTRIENSSALGTAASGGAVFNSGTLRAQFSTFEGNSAERAGGAIEAAGGTTDVDDSVFLTNTCGPNPGNGGAFHLTGPGIVDFKGSRFEGNVAASEGGGLWNSAAGLMRVEQCQVLNNTANGMAADNGGGGLFNDGGFLDVQGSVVLGNAAPMGSGSGGGMFNNAGTLNVLRTIVEGNQSNRAGGGIEALVGNTSVRFSALVGNNTGAAPGNGGGLHLTGAGNVLVERSRVLGNTASAEGGGLWNSSTGFMLVLDSGVSDNTASGAASDQGGGGLFNDGGLMRVERTNVNNNLADGTAGSGGGALNNGGVLSLISCNFIGNDCRRAGGGVEALLGTTTLVDVKLEGNSTGAAPGNGGGLHLTGAGYVTLLNGSVRENHADNEGGGLWNSGTGTMYVTSVAIGANTSPKGPNLFNVGGTFLVDGVPVPVLP